MIDIVDKSKCCGCGACEQVCPAECLSLVPDVEGFLYPKVDKELCIYCNLCEKVCPFINSDVSESIPISVLGAKNMNDEIRDKSSSGGIFYILAEYVIKQGGVVFGVKFNEKWEAVYSYARNIEEVIPFLGSKYLQSKVGDMFLEVEKFLQEGVMVLFSGTPCQIDGLLRMLQKPYSNLVTVAVICHGVPSPKVWNKYLTMVTSRYGDGGYTNPSIKISKVAFRDKTEGWKNFSCVIEAYNSTKLLENNLGPSLTENTVVHELFHNNIFMNAFLSDIILRPSCYSCKSKHYNNFDLLLGDYWGIENINPQFDDDKGVSAIIVFSEKGDRIIKNIDIDSFKTLYDDVLNGNHAIKYSPTMHPNRRYFFTRIDNTDLGKLIHDSINNLPIGYRIKRKMNLLLNKVKR